MQLRKHKSVAQLSQAENKNLSSYSKISILVANDEEASLEFLNIILTKVIGVPQENVCLVDNGHLAYEMAI